MRRTGKVSSSLLVFGMLQRRDRSGHTSKLLFFFSPEPFGVLHTWLLASQHGDASRDVVLDALQQALVATWSGFD